MVSPAPKLSSLAMKKAAIPVGLEALSKNQLVSLVQGLSTERDNLQGACRALARQQSSGTLSPPLSPVRAKKQVVAKKRERRGPEPGPCASWWGEGETMTEAKAKIEMVAEEVAEKVLM